MSETPTVYVNILDKDYQVACPVEEKAALIRAADELDQRMRGIRASGTIIGLERIAVMAALNLCHELQQVQTKGTAGSLDPEAVKRIFSKLDKAIESSDAN